MPVVGTDNLLVCVVAVITAIYGILVFLKWMSENDLGFLFQIVIALVERNYVKKHPTENSTIMVAGQIMTVANVIRRLAKANVNLTPELKIRLTNIFIEHASAHYGVAPERILAIQSGQQLKLSSGEAELEMAAYAFSLTLQALQNQHDWSSAINAWLIIKK